MGIVSPASGHHFFHEWVSPITLSGCGFSCKWAWPTPPVTAFPACPPQAVFLRTFPCVYCELLKIFTVREVAGFVRETLGSLPAISHADCPLEAVKLQCIAKTVESSLYTNPGTAMGS